MFSSYIDVSSGSASAFSSADSISKPVSVKDTGYAFSTATSCIVVPSDTAAVSASVLLIYTSELAFSSAAKERSISSHSPISFCVCMGYPYFTARYVPSSNLKCFSFSLLLAVSSLMILALSIFTPAYAESCASLSVYSGARAKVASGSAVRIIITDNIAAMILPCVFIKILS
ncbi:hypothetical protein IMSAG013_00597 [Clostridiales bacterium]|nr:hypothetical protein IMSAG013_00597 [Clostridiales bacterium]